MFAESQSSTHMTIDSVWHSSTHDTRDFCIDFRNHQRTCITYTKEHIDNILVVSLILLRGTVGESARRAIG